MNVKTKWIKRLLQTVVLLFLIITLVPWPIDRSVEALEIKTDDPEYKVPLSMNIKGKYHINIFKSDRFYGQITVSGYVMTEKQMSAFDVDDDALRLLFYDSKIPDDTLKVTKEAGSTIDIVFGQIFTDFLLKNVIILPNERVASHRDLEAILPNEEVLLGDGLLWNTNNWIVCGVNTREEAIEKLSLYKPDLIERFNVDIVE